MKKLFIIKFQNSSLNTKRKIIFLGLLLFFNLTFNINSSAQLRIGKDTKSTTEKWYKRASALKKTTLMVAIDDENSLVSKKLIAAVETYWKFTPHQFIKTTEIDKYLKDPQYSILFLAKFVSDTKASEYAYGIVLGDKKNKKIGDAALVSSIPLPDSWTKKTGATLLDFKYLTTFFVQALQKDVTDSYEKKIHKTYAHKHAHYYDNGLEEIKDKKILISKAALNPDFNKTNFLRNFGLKEEQVFIVEKEGIEEALEKQDEKVAFIYDFTGKLGTIYSIKGANALAYGSDYNMRLNDIYKYTASAAGIGVFIYIVKTQMGGKQSE